MSILSSMKEERRLSFNNWRYRLLHWTFNVQNADEAHPERTGLPRFLYTHYCPLFHLTNLIAILLPLLLLIRLIGVFFRTTITVLGMIDVLPLMNGINCVVVWVRSRLPQPVLVSKKELPPPTKENERLKMLLAFTLDGTTDFANFWQIWGHKYTRHNKEEAYALFQAYITPILLARARKAQRRAAFQAQLIFWINFSRVFLKWGMNVAYVVLAVGLAYLAYATAGALWYAVSTCAAAAAQGIWWFLGETASLLGSLFTSNASLAVGKASVITALVAGVLYLVGRSPLTTKFIALFCAGCSTIAPPFYVVGRFFTWCGACCGSACEFVAMFYEENCPPITLVTKEQAIVEGEEQV